LLWVTLVPIWQVNGMDFQRREDGSSPCASCSVPGLAYQRGAKSGMSPNRTALINAAMPDLGEKGPQI
jgi:hypothetical protein